MQIFTVYSSKWLTDIFVKMFLMQGWTDYSGSLRLFSLFSVLATTLLLQLPVDELMHHYFSSCNKIF